MQYLFQYILLCCAMSHPLWAQVYVVDQRHPGASDDNAGTPDAPWKTIAKGAATAKAGDSVLVMEGEYPEVVTPANPGEEHKPITFRGLPRHQARVAGFDTKNCPHLRIEGFRIQGDNPVGVRVASDSVIVSDNHFHDMLKEAIGVHESALSSESPRNAHIICNNIHSCGKGIVSGGSRWIVERNNIERLIARKGSGDADYTRPFGVNHVFRYNYLHGSKKEDIGKSHVDGFQVFDNNGYIARSTLIEGNVVSDFHQAQMMEGKFNPGNVVDFTYRKNIFFQRGWAIWGLCGTGSGGLTVDRNTFINSMCSASETGSYTNNLLYASLYTSGKGKPAGKNDRNNLVFYPDKTIPATGMSHAPMPYEHNLMNKDPLLRDLTADDVRLQKGSPAIAAGVDGVDIGALSYPATYYVDALHPGASDTGHGYPGAPFKTIAKALQVAQDGETVILREGCYRELVQPTRGGVVIKALAGEKPVISGADLVAGWRRCDSGDAWEATVDFKPAKVLKDGRPFDGCSYDAARRVLSVTGFDPRINAIEIVVRPNGIDLSKAPATKVDGIAIVNTLAATTP